ncbi:nucleoside-diphosphatase mig-23, putative [Plasmodium malariae]|uniref:Nucleoside-diphosphatase mig-23, putative n=1 Tax=Plasmodium malariae TaxID=5858 RepID=A0A1C3L0Z7_PLAMA|nr:nucleoside-diphosphatase mig-23, putative [Plasmodium malariae]
MKNERAIKKEPVRLIILFYAILIYLNIRINGEKINNNLENNEQENLENNYIQKSVVIDAGSTGTRVHIYNYEILNNNKDIKIYIPSVSYRTTPGLVYLLNNYFTNNDKESFYDYFKNIKNFIYGNVMESERSMTVIIIRASGGFRLLSVQKSEEYISFIKSYFYTYFNEFLLIDDLLIKVLSGKEEAILSFVSIYALLEKLSPSPVFFTNKKENDKNSTSDGIEMVETDKGKTLDDRITKSVDESHSIRKFSKDQDDTIGVLELGGATAQIIVKIPLSNMSDDILNVFNYQHKENKNKESFIEENYKNRNIVKIRFFNSYIYLYCKSYLVLGRQNAMKTYLHYVVHKHYKKEDKTNKFIPLACFPKDFKFHINNLYKTSIEEELKEYHGNTQLGEDEYVGVGTGQYNLCKTQIRDILDHSQIDSLPFKMKKFIKLYGIENFHHFAIDILNISESYNPMLLNTDMYMQKAEQVCPLTIDEIRKVVRPESNIEKAQTSCFGLIYLHEFMRYTLKIDEPISFYSTNYINHINITWTVAVLLMELPPYLHLIEKHSKKNYSYDEL